MKHFPGRWHGYFFLFRRNNLFGWRRGYFFGLQPGIFFGYLMLLPVIGSAATPDIPGGTDPACFISDTTILPPANFFTKRNGLDNSFRMMAATKTATVAFLGGSITYNPGWRNKTCAFLQQRFPATHFHFIAAGIPSLGSLPHAFRLQRDVLDSGKVDLLFVEAAVNDRGNGTDSLTQVRALEGIVRHARRNNPSMDIIFMSFADPAKNKDYDEGRIPVEVANHELIANYYGFPSINLAKEVHDKIANKEFSWEKDIKDLHPSPFGQEIYFAAIKDLLNACYDSVGLARISGGAITGTYQGTGGGSRTTGVKLPAALDAAALEKGEYYPIEKAKFDKGWTLDPSWSPTDKLPTREGFVQVPMLVTTTPGASLSLTFKGTAVGMSLISGADAGIVSYSVDNGPDKQIDLFTQWSGDLHLPWYVLFGAGLKNTRHTLRLKIAEMKNNKSKGTACRIVHFLINR